MFLKLIVHLSDINQSIVLPWVFMQIFNWEKLGVSSDTNHLWMWLVTNEETHLHHHVHMNTHQTTIFYISFYIYEVTLEFTLYLLDKYATFSATCTVCQYRDEKVYMHVPQLALCTYIEPPPPGHQINVWLWPQQGMDCWMNLCHCLFSFCQYKYTGQLSLRISAAIDWFRVLWIEDSKR
jgi:hypothetical protein